MKNLKVTIAGVELNNPVMTASGTFGSGAEYSEFVDLNHWPAESRYRSFPETGHSLPQTV